MKKVDREKQRAVQELDALRRRAQLEQKRLLAQQRLQETKQRRQMAAIASSQQVNSQNIPPSQSFGLSQTTNDAAVPKPPASRAVKPHPPEVQSSGGPPLDHSTEVEKSVNREGTGERVKSEIDGKRRMIDDNTRLIAVLNGGITRDLLVLQHLGIRERSKIQHNELETSGSSSDVNSLDDAKNNFGFNGRVQSLYVSSDDDTGYSCSRPNIQSVVHGLHDTLGAMLRGETSSLSLLSALIQYLKLTVDLDTRVLIAVLRALYTCMVDDLTIRCALCIPAASNNKGSELPQSADPSNKFECLKNSVWDTDVGWKGGSNTEFPNGLESLRAQQHPRILIANSNNESPVDAGISESASLNQDFTPAQEAIQRDLMSGISRVLKNNLADATLVSFGLDLLCLWSGSLMVQRLDGFKHLITDNVVQDILFSPKSTLRNKTSCVKLLSQLIQSASLFSELQVSAKKSLLFNRVVRILSSPNTAMGGVKLAYDIEELYLLQLSIITLMSALVASYPMTGLQFLLDNSRGHLREADGDKSVIYHLVMLLDRESCLLRSLRAEQSDINIGLDHIRRQVVRDSFMLLAQLIQYVDIQSELPKASQEQTLHTLLLWLGGGDLDAKGDCVISQTATNLLRILGVYHGTVQNDVGAENNDENVPPQCATGG